MVLFLLSEFEMSQPRTEWVSLEIPVIPVQLKDTRSIDKPDFSAPKTRTPSHIPQDDPRRLMHSDRSE